MVFREGRTKAIGSVTKIKPIVPGSPQLVGTKLKPTAKHFPHRLGAQGGGGNRGRRRGGKKHTKGPYPIPPAKEVAPSSPLKPLAAAKPLQKDTP